MIIDHRHITVAPNETPHLLLACCTFTELSFVDQSGGAPHSSHPLQPPPQVSPSSKDFDDWQTVLFLITFPQQVCGSRPIGMHGGQLVELL